jgi:hypothetical protein
MTIKEFVLQGFRFPHKHLRDISFPQAVFAALLLFISNTALFISIGQFGNINYWTMVPTASILVGLFLMCISTHRRGP